MRTLKAILIGLGALAAGVDRAACEEKPAIETLVRQSSLIVRCRAEVIDGKVWQRVIESWKGSFDPRQMAHQPKAGFLFASATEEHASPIASPVHGREVVFFFSARKIDNNEFEKYGRHHAWFVSVNGRYVYDRIKTPAYREREVYTLDTFKQVILAAAKLPALEPIVSAPASGEAAKIAVRGPRPAKADKNTKAPEFWSDAFFPGSDKFLGLKHFEEYARSSNVIAAGKVTNMSEGTLSVSLTKVYHFDVDAPRAVTVPIKTLPSGIAEKSPVVVFLQKSPTDWSLRTDVHSPGVFASSPELHRMLHAIFE